MTAKVLLVEDEVMTVKQFKRVMEKFDVQVDSYNSIDELRQHYCELDDYKTVFVDLKLDKNGWHSRGKDILNEMVSITDKPFYVIWTAFGECPEAEECLNNGASLVIAKDGNVRKLSTLVHYINKTYEPSHVDV